MTNFKLLFWLSTHATVSIRLFFHNFSADTRPCYGSYRFHMLLGIAIQSGINTFGLLVFLSVCVIYFVYVYGVYEYDVHPCVFIYCINGCVGIYVCVRVYQCK